MLLRLLIAVVSWRGGLSTNVVWACVCGGWDSVGKDAGQAVRLYRPRPYARSDIVYHVGVELGRAKRVRLHCAVWLYRHVVLSRAEPYGEIVVVSRRHLTRGVVDGYPGGIAKAVGRVIVALDGPIGCCVLLYLLW